LDLSSRLAAIPGLAINEEVPLASYTRFAIGGPARLLVDASTEHALAGAIAILEETGSRYTVIGGGTNLLASDLGFPDVVLRYTAVIIEVDGTMVRAGAGAVLQDLVDVTISWGLRGLETMTGIPGWVGGAVYGNAGAYGHSIDERIQSVRFFDGVGVREIGSAECAFHYRESIFKRNKNWIVLAVVLVLDRAEPSDLKRVADEILRIRNEKYPPSMCCAGSIFKNLLLAEIPEPARSEVPERVIREGKVPSAYFLEQAGAKGLVKGGVRVADYHANLIYNSGGGTARQVRELIGELKRRVSDRFGLELEEEIQYLE